MNRKHQRQVPLKPPRPSPTKRKYAKFNEPRRGDLNYAFRPVVVVEVVVLRAKGLKNTDGGGLIFGTSDPYAVVRVGPPQALLTVGKTRVVNNSLDPVWGDAAFRFPIHLDCDCAGYELVVELWDSDGLLASGGKSDDALGQCTVSPDEYLNATGPIRKELRPQPGEAPVQGWVELRVSLLGRVAVHLEGLLDDDDNIAGGAAGAVTLAPRWLGWGSTKYKRVAASGGFFEVDVPLQRAGGSLALEASRGGAGLAGLLTARRAGGACALSTPVGSCLVEQTQLLVCDGPQLRLPLVRSKDTHSRSASFGGPLKGVLAKRRSRSSKSMKDTNMSPPVLLVRVECPMKVAQLASAVRAARELQLTANSLPSLARVEVDVLRASRLRSADTFSLSDPFVQGWHRGKKVGTTKVKNDCLDPIWEDDGESATFAKSARAEYRFFERGNVRQTRSRTNSTDLGRVRVPDTLIKSDSWPLEHETDPNVGSGWTTCEPCKTRSKSPRADDPTSNRTNTLYCSRYWTRTDPPHKESRRHLEKE